MEADADDYASSVATTDSFHSRSYHASKSQSIVSVPIEYVEEPSSNTDLSHLATNEVSNAESSSVWSSGHGNSDADERYQTPTNGASRSGR